MNLKLIVKVNFHRLALRIVSVLIVKMPLLQMLWRDGSSFKLRLLLIQFLHVVRVGWFGKQHDLLVRVARVACDELGRRLVAIHSATSLTLSIVWFSSYHCVEFLPLEVCHPINLLMKLLSPFLLVLNNLLTCITIHIWFCVAETHDLWIWLLIFVIGLDHIGVFVLLCQLNLIFIERVVF